LACSNRATLNVVSLLLEYWPESIKETDENGYTSLHTACEYGAPLDIVSFLLNNWAGATKEKDNWGFTPLHTACRYAASSDVVSFVLESWPDALKEKTNYKITVLSMACQYAPLETVVLLLDKWLGYKENRNIRGMMALKAYSTIAPLEDVRKLFSQVNSLLFDKSIDKSTKRPIFCPNEIINYFLSIQLWNGVSLVIDVQPTVIKSMDLHTNVMAEFLSMTGRCCKLTTMWDVVRNEPDILEDV